MIIESVISQYCDFNSAGGVVWYLTFREPGRVEDQDCRVTWMVSKLTIVGKEFWVTPGTTISHSTFLLGDLMDDSYCSNGVLGAARRLQDWRSDDPGSVQDHCLGEVWQDE